MGQIATNYVLEHIHMIDIKSIFEMSHNDDFPPYKIFHLKHDLVAGLGEVVQSGDYSQWKK